MGGGGEGEGEVGGGRGRGREGESTTLEDRGWEKGATPLTVVLCVSDFVNFSMEPESRLATDCIWGRLLISAPSWPLI